MCASQVLPLNKHKQNILETRNQPFSLESEHVVIGACLLESDGSVYDTCSQIVDASDFYLERHRILFETIGQLVSDGVEISTITLLEKLRSNGQEDHVGGYTAISAIQDSVETATHASFSAKVVKEASRKRGIIRTAREAVEACYEGETRSDDVIASMDKRFQDIAENGSSDFNLKAALEQAGDELTTDREHESIPIGIPSYDATMGDGGMVGGQVHVLAARPGRGKTTLALNTSGRTLRDGKGVGIISLEMNAVELLKKMVCMKSGLDFDRFKAKVHSRAEQEKYDDAMATMSEWNLVIDERTFMTVEGIKATARQWKRKNDIKLLVIDYLQLIMGSNKKENREGQVSEISRNIKLLAKELNIPILLLAQLNRESEKENRAPRLTDLRESGSIEQDSDIVTFLYVKNEDKDAAGHTSLLRWNRPKQRNGQCDCFGTFKFNGKLGTIYD